MKGNGITASMRMHKIKCHCEDANSWIDFWNCDENRKRFRKNYSDELGKSLQKFFNDFISCKYGNAEQNSRVQVLLCKISAIIELMSKPFFR